MTAYDSAQPLFFSHVPKCAGTSLRIVFARWFPEKCLFQGAIRDAGTANLPLQIPRGGLVYAHFNRVRGWGLERFEPPQKQIFTMLRDPWERAISGYFYRKMRVSTHPIFQKVASMSLKDYLQGYPYEDPDLGPPMSNFLPIIRDESDLSASLDPYVRAVGIVEDYETSVRMFAKILGQPLPSEWNAKRNQSQRDHTSTSHLLPEFRERNKLDYALYDWAKLRLSYWKQNNKSEEQ